MNRLTECTWLYQGSEVIRSRSMTKGQIMVIHFVGGSRSGETKDFPGEAGAADGLLFDGRHPERYRPLVPRRTLSTSLGEAAVLVFEPAGTT